MIGAFTSGEKNEKDADDDERGAPRHRNREQPEREWHGDIANAASFNRSAFCASLLRDERTRQGTDAERPEEVPKDVRVRVVVEVGERLHGDDEALRTMLTRQAARTVGRAAGRARGSGSPPAHPWRAPVCSTREPARTRSEMTAKEKKYVPASMTSTAAGLVAAISTPARTGPRICVSCVAAAKNRAASRDEPLVLAENLREDQARRRGSRAPRSSRSRTSRRGARRTRGGASTRGSARAASAARVPRRRGASSASRRDGRRASRQGCRRARTARARRRAPSPSEPPIRSWRARTTGARRRSSRCR